MTNHEVDIWSQRLAEVAKAQQDPSIDEQRRYDLFSLRETIEMRNECGSWGHAAALLRDLKAGGKREGFLERLENIWQEAMGSE